MSTWHCHYMRSGSYSMRIPPCWFIFRMHMLLHRLIDYSSNTYYLQTSPTYVYYQRSLITSYLFFQHWHLIYFLFKRISLLPYIIMLGLQHFRFVNVTNRDVSNIQRHQYTLVTWYFRQKTFIYAPPFWDWGTRASASLALIRPPS